MTDQYMRDVMRLAVGQICQTIGYNASQVAPLELLQDIMHKFIQELCRDLRRQVEHYNRNEPNLNDMYLTMRSVNVNIGELLDYVNNVEPVPFLHDVPKFPAAKHSNLNFLKAGSKEVLTRPLHIFEHLPPIEPPEPSVQYDKKYMDNEHGPDQAAVNSLDLDEPVKMDHHTEASQTAAPPGVEEFQQNSTFSSLPPFLRGPSMNAPFLDDGGSTREISSVVMTTGGFISPAREGKLPVTMIPDIIYELEGLNAPPSPVSKPQIPPAQAAFAPSLNFTADNIKKEIASPVEASKEKGHGPKFFDKIVKTEKGIDAKPLSGRAMKKSALNQHGGGSAQGPNMVSKILKKAKKKPPMMFSLHAKQLNADDANGLNANDFDMTDKAQRKQFKMLQKLSKSRNYMSTDISPSVVEGMPPGPERQQMEKLIKKQHKQKQKLLKQQKTFSLKNRPGPAPVDNKNLLFNQGLPANEAFSAAEQKPTPNKQADGTVGDTFHFSNEGSVSQTYLGVKNELSAIADALNDQMHIPSGDGPPLKNMGVQMKLPCEPDRSKLNVLKKISKQKLPDPMASNSGFKGNLGTVFACSDNQVINLPSGTTITPAPPSDDPAAATLYGENKPRHVMDALQTPSTDGVTNLFEENGTANALPPSDRPKKRGRKPGSKNQPKIPGASPSGPLKMTKKMKMEYKKFKGNNMPVAVAPLFGPNAQPLGAEPLNLTYANPMENLAMPFPNTMPGALNVKGDFQVNPAKVRREKKKNKDKALIISSGGGLPDQNAELFGLPTKEEVNSINRKLSRIDTVLKPAPGHPIEFPDTMGELGVVPPSKLFPPSKTTGKQKRSPNVPTSNLTSFVPTSGFPIPMLYPFVPRPGLIPTPGIFPNPILTNFANNPKKSLSNMLMPNCMPFPNLNHGNQLKFPKDAANESLDELTLQSSGLKYCNVPPLVPEANKFGSVALDKQQTDSVKVSKMQFSGHLNENEGFMKATHLHGPDFKLPGGSAKLSFEEGDGLYSSHHHQQATGIFSQAKTNESALPISLNPGEPIEVSDDSLDSMPKAKTSMNVGLISVKSEAAMKSTAVTSSGLKMNASVSSMNSEVYLQREESEVKKTQRAKKRLSTSIGGVLCKDNGITSGGVEFIPLPETGVSYSSKTIPPTSLTASGPLQFPVINAKEVVKCTSEITITPSTPADLERPHHKDKDHKKMKKLKEGKIKKKKDKKDKMKNKERFEKCLEDTSRKGPDADKHRDKDLIKKLKKEKKKEKQRMALEGAHDFPTLPASQLTGAFENGAPPTGLLQVPSCSSTTSSVPKLTLKLGNSPSPITTNPADDSPPKMKRSPGGNLLQEREKKESSPELAKISPLVTRPPKQKPNTSDSDAQDLDYGNASKLDSLTTGNAHPNITNSSLFVPPSPWLPGGTLAASCVLLPQQLMQSSKRTDPPQAPAATVASGEDLSAVSGNNLVTVKEVSRPSSYVDDHGNRVWICPACGKVDDGSAMIGCDGCDAWYHWVCVGIVVAPKDNEDWFCRVCITRKKGADKKKKRNKKK